MTRIFTDTSAFYAYLVADDINHDAAKKLLVRHLEAGDVLTTHSFVVLETLSLLHNRLGHRPAIAWFDGFSDHLDVRWVDADLFSRAMKLYKKFARERYSFTDVTSFAFMKGEGLKKVLCFDDDFKAQGFEILS